MFAAVSREQPPLIPREANSAPAPAVMAQAPDKAEPDDSADWHVRKNRQGHTASGLLCRTAERLTESGSYVNAAKIPINQNATDEAC